MKLFPTVLLGIALALALFDLNRAIAQAPSKNTLTYDLGSARTWVPYQRGFSKDSDGIFKKFTDALEKHSTLHFDYAFYPPKRAEMAMKEGKVDFDFIVWEWMSTPEPGPEHVVSAPIFQVTEYIVTRKGEAHLYPDTESYFGHKIGTIAGYFYFNDDQFQRVDFLNESLLVQGLTKGRFDAIILERETAKYWAHELGVEIDFAAIHTQGDITMRLRKSKAYLLPQINEAIRTIQRNGELTRILQQFGLHSSAYDTYIDNQNTQN